MILSGPHCNHSRNQCAYSHTEDGTVLLLGRRVWDHAFCCAFLLPQGCEKGLEEEYVSSPLPVPYSSSQLPVNFSTPNKSKLENILSAPVS